jgi:hypothetical protein
LKFSENNGFLKKPAKRLFGRAWGVTPSTATLDRRFRAISALSKIFGQGGGYFC